MSTIVLEAKKREFVGSGKSKKYRREGMVPGVFYRSGDKAVPLLFDEKALSYFVNHARGLVDLTLDGEKKARKCILKAIQFHPVTESVLHVDFVGVKMGQKLQMTVPVMLSGDAIGVKNGGILQHLLRELEIECLPKNIPDQLTVDIADLDIGKAIHVSDLKYDDVTILTDGSETVALVELAKAAKSETEEEGIEEEAEADAEATEEA